MAGAVPRRGAKLALGLVVSALFLWATFRTVSLDRVAEAVAAARPGWIAVALVFIVLAYLLKIYRWLTMLRTLGAAIGMRQAAAPFLAGVAFNNVLPLRAGDLIRVLAFQRFTGVPASGQIGTLALERLMDLLVLTGLLFATITLWRDDLLDGSLLAVLRAVALAAVLAVLMFMLAPGPIRHMVQWAEERLPRLRRAGEALLRLSAAVATLSRPLFLIRILLLTILAWLAEGGAYLAVGAALGLGLSPQLGLLALGVGTLSTMIPSSPGYVGTFHFFVARVVAAFGAAPVVAAAYAVLIHALLWLATTGCGFLALAFSGKEAASGDGRTNGA